MSRIVFNTATTANGFLADEHDSLDWLFAVQGETPDMTPFTDGVGVLVMGSHTYEWLLWQDDVLHSPGVWESWSGAKPVFVFTSRELPRPAGSDVRFCKGPVVEHLPTFRQAAGGKDIWVQGGGDLAGQFLDAGALDRITVTIAPAFLTTGRSLLPRTLTPTRLTLAATHQVGQFVQITWDVMTDHPSA